MLLGNKVFFIVIVIVMTISNALSWMNSFFILIPISLKFVPKGPIDNMSALVRVLACFRTSNKPLSEPMLTQFIYAYMWHQGEMS